MNKVKIFLVAVFVLSSASCCSLKATEVFRVYGDNYAPGCAAFLQVVYPNQLFFEGFSRENVAAKMNQSMAEFAQDLTDPVGIGQRIGTYESYLYEAVQDLKLAQRRLSSVVHPGDDEDIPEDIVGGN